MEPNECEHKFLQMLTPSPRGEWKCADCDTVISYAKGKRMVIKP